MAGISCACHSTHAAGAPQLPSPPFLRELFSAPSTGQADLHASPCRPLKPAPAPHQQNVQKNARLLFFGWPWPRRPSSRCRSVALKEGLRAEENCRAAATSPLGHYYRELRHSEKPSALIIHRPSASTPYPYWRTLLQCSWDRPRIGIVIDVPLRCCCLNAAVLSKYHGE